MKQRYIVGEVSKNWVDDPPEQIPASEMLCGLFERLINTNFQRGYRLISWKLSRLVTPGEVLNETIIAVFEFIDQTGCASSAGQRNARPGDASENYRAGNGEFE